MLKQQYDIHPAATIFPMMTDDEYEGLKQDISENGQREDIVVWCGKLIDGRNRLRACEELGRTPDIAELDEDQDPWKYVISHNLHRRHLTTSQRASVAAKMAKLKHGGDRKSDEIKSQICASITDAATQLNVSPRSVTNAKIVQEHGSDSVKKAVEQGELSVSLAAKLVKKFPNKKEQSKILSDGIQSVRDAVREPSKKSTVSEVDTSSDCFEWVDVVDDDEPQEDCKLDEFKRFWSKCSDLSKTAIRIWINDQNF